MQYITIHCQNYRDNPMCITEEIYVLRRWRAHHLSASNRLHKIIGRISLYTDGSKIVRTKTTCAETTRDYELMEKS